MIHRKKERENLNGTLLAKLSFEELERVSGGSNPRVRGRRKRTKRKLPPQTPLITNPNAGLEIVSQEDESDDE